MGGAATVLVFLLLVIFLAAIGTGLYFALSPTWAPPSAPTSSVPFALTTGAPFALTTAVGPSFGSSTTLEKRQTAPSLAKLLPRDLYYRIIEKTPETTKPLFRYEGLAQAVSESRFFRLSADEATAKRELACLLTMAWHEVRFEYTEQLCDSGNPLNCREKMGDRSTGFGRGLVQLTGEPNYRDFSKDAFGDDRLVRDPDLVIRDASLFWQSGLWFFSKKLQRYMAAPNPSFAKAMWFLCCSCVKAGLDEPTKRARTFQRFCEMLNTWPGTDLIANGPQSDDPC